MIHNLFLMGHRFLQTPVHLFGAQLSEMVAQPLEVGNARPELLFEPFAIQLLMLSR